MNCKFLKLLSFLVTLEIIVVCGVVQASWEAPSAAPPNENRPRPLNESALPQGKSGALWLTNNADGSKNTTSFFYGLLMKDASPLIFGDPLDKYVGFQAPSNITNSQIWTLPISDGANGYVLATNANGQLYWANPTATMHVDGDWHYLPSDTNYNEIHSQVFTRVGSSSTTLNMTNPNAGDGDLYVQKRLEVDGLIYEQNATGNAEIQLQSGANNHWGLYVDATANDLRFWQGDNRVTFTNTGRVGIGTTAPSQALDVVGGIKLTGLIFNSAGTMPNSGQILSNNGSNINWIDPALWTNTSPDYVYATKNTRIGNTGTVDQATGVGDLYVQNELEVDGNAFLKNITATGLSLGFPTGVVPFQGASGLAYDASNFFWNDSTKHLGIGTSTPADFTLQVAGHVGPNVNNQFDLGSTAKRWRNIFGTNLDLTGTLNLGFVAGSVIFQGDSGLAESNSKFFWDKNNNRLGIGTSTPTQILDVNGNINLANTTFNKTAGVLYMGGEVFMHSAAKSIQADPSWMTDYYSNTYVGRDAGSFPATVNDEISFYDNSALGFWALKNNQADSNTAIGSRSLFSNTSGWGNSALGVFSLTNNTIGILNSAVGYYALSSNVSGDNNTAFGSNALAANLASNNTAFGNGSLSANTSGTHNTAVGIGAGQTNSTGYENLFLGDGSGDSNSVGNQNIYAGYLAGHLHASGDENVFLGHSAGYGNTSSTGTVAIGSGAGHNGNGSGNIFLGTKAGFYETGSYKLYIDSADRNADNALIYGKFYSAGDPNPMLRFNGRVGITPMGTANFTPNSLLHIYDPSGSNNAEIDIQSVSGANNHWGIYQNRTDSGLRFWNNNTAGNKDILSLALIGATTKYGAVGIGTGTSTPPNSLLHLYQTDSSAPNAELDIQSFANDVSGGVAQQRQWSMYQDRTTKQLRFWNAFAGSFATTSETYTYNLNSPYNNLLMLTDYGSVGIGMHSNNIPLGRLEVHSVGENSLTLSSYNSNYSGGGGNSINFVGVLTKADGSKDKGVSTQLFSSFSDVSSDSTFGIKLPDPTSGALYDKAVFTNPLFTFSPSNRAVFTSKVNVGGIHSDTPNNYTLAVTGSIHGDDYYAGDNSQGATAYLCLGIPSGSGISAVRLRFVDGLYVCSCGAGSLCPGNNCTCN